MQARYLMVNLLFICLLMGGAAHAKTVVDLSTEKEYNINEVCKGDDSLILTTVVNTADKTTIHFKYTNSKNYTEEMTAFPPKHKKAYYISNKDGTKKYPLVSVKGLAINPEWTEVAPNESIKYSLIFDKIPMNAFNLIEGEESLDDLISWHFLNIKLQ